MVKTRGQKSQTEMGSSGEEELRQEISQIKDEISELKSLKEEMLEIKQLLMMISSGVGSRTNINTISSSGVSTGGNITTTMETQVQYNSLSLIYLKGEFLLG